MLSSKLFRRVKTKIRRSGLTTAIILVCLLCATFVLFYRLPSGQRVTREADHFAEEKAQPIVEEREVKVKEDRDDKPHRASFEENDIKEGDFAWYKEGVLGNYEPSSKLKRSKGRPGDGGAKVELTSFEDVDWNEVNALKGEYGMNLVASSHVPMDRVLNDLRHPECKYWSYKDELPSASVVIVFHNEGFTTLLRTVHSVLLRSPRKFLREVLLVDDYSDKEPLKAQLVDYILEHFGHFKKQWNRHQYSEKEGREGETLEDRSGKVRLIRNRERQGLIRSRSRGAQEALGDVVVFLDAHCEVSYNWLPPLLAPIAKNRKTLTVPIIDGIDSNNFNYRPVYAHNDQHFRGIWEWGMLYKEIQLDMPKHLEKHRVSEPYDSPTHAGGLFAIDRQYFLDLGTYDDGLLVWGGENFELSFKVWQCGGRLQWVPCSRVGHIYRPFMPYSFGSLASQRKGPLVLTNYKRVIEVWFDDEYKEYFYTREPLARFYDAGDISKPMGIKEKYNCKSFDWFMKNVAYDVFRDFPRLPPNVQWGEIKNKRSGQCLDTGSSQPPSTVSLTYCHGHGGNQLFRLNAEGQLGMGERCLEASTNKMSLTYCKLGTVDGPWKYDRTTRQMIYTTSNMCLDVNESTGKPHLAECQDTETQKWIWKTIKPRL